jgi:pilus assembly protein CpaE
VAQDISRLDASLLAASTVKLAPNLNVLAAPEDLARAVEVRPEHLEKILSLATSQYEFVVLDLDRRLDALTVKALDRAQRIYAVLQSGLPSVRNAARLLEAFRSLGYPSEKVGLILNRYEKSAPIGLDQIRRSMGEVAITTVANSYREVSTSINHGDALAKNHRSNLVTRQLAELCESLNPRQDAQRSLLNRLLRRA